MGAISSIILVMAFPLNLPIYTATKTPGALQQALFRLSHNAGQTSEESKKAFDSVFRTATAGSAISATQVVFASGNNAINKAQANALATSRAVGIAPTAIANGAQGEYQLSGVVEVAGWGLTTGLVYYLSAVTPGGLVSTPDAVAGQYVVVIGKALAPDKLVLQIAPGILL